MELLSPHSGTIFWTIVTFVLLLFILGKLAWKPILQMLDERETKIRESLAEADKARAEAQVAMAEQSKAIDAAKKEAQEMMSKGRKAAETAKEEIIEKANQEAEHIIAKAKREIELSRDKAMEEIRDLAVNLSMAATAKLIGQSLSKEDHKKFIDE